MHEALDRAFAGAIRIAHRRRDFALLVESQPFLGAPGGEVQMAPHRPEEALGTLEPAIFLGGQQSRPDQFGRLLHAMDIFADPVERMEIAKPALAVLDVGLDDIAAVPHPRMALVALGELGANKLARGSGDDVAAEAKPCLFRQALVAPQEACLEQRGPHRHVGPGQRNCFLRGAQRLADLQLQIPQQIEQRLGDLLAPRRAALRHQHHQVDVGERRHLAAPGAAKPDQRDPLGGGGIGIGVQPLGDEIIGQSHDLVGEEGVSGGMGAAPARLGDDPRGNLGAAMVERVAEQAGRGGLEVASFRE